MAHIRAEVFDGRIGRLAVVAVGMVHIPKRRQLVAGKLVHQPPQPRRIGVDAAGLDQNGELHRLRVADQRLERFGDGHVVIVQRHD